MTATGRLHERGPPGRVPGSGVRDPHDRGGVRRVVGARDRIRRRGGELRLTFDGLDDPLPGPAGRPPRGGELGGQGERISARLGRQHARHHAQPGRHRRMRPAVPGTRSELPAGVLRIAPGRLGTVPAEPAGLRRHWHGNPHTAAASDNGSIDTTDSFISRMPSDAVSTRGIRRPWSDDLNGSVPALLYRG